MLKPEFQFIGNPITFKCCFYKKVVTGIGTLAIISFENWSKIDVQDIPKEIRKTALNFKTIIKIVPPCIPPIRESFPHQNFTENSWKWQRILLRWCLALNSIQPVTIKYLMPRINLLLQMPLHCHELFSLVPLYKLVKINLCSRFCNIYFQN